METIGGSELTVPAQARVIMFLFSGAFGSAQLTSTTGTGFSIVEGLSAVYFNDFCFMAATSIKT